MQKRQDLVKPVENNPEFLVKLFKHYKMAMNKNVLFIPNMDKIPFVTTYRKNKKTFDKLSFILDKYSISPEGFIRYCVTELGIQDPKNILKCDNFSSYASNIKANEKRKSIYENYIKSADFVASECIRTNMDPVSFIRNEISENKLAIDYMTGKLSMYFIATINGIETLCEKMDQNSIAELGIIFDAREKLNQDVQDVFMKFKNTRVSPIRFVESIIKEKQQNKTR